ncbi:MAG: cyanophycinase [Candidatus Sumerlaeia bacterium]|nr:cyanophycinase [Candidatus Sumerlaeia bacterium]
MRPVRRLLPLLLAVTALPALAAPTFTTGTLFILAGNTGSNNNEVWNAMIAAAQAHGGPIGVVPAASSGSAQSDADFLNGKGGAGSAIAIDLGNDWPGSAESPAIVSQIQSCGGIFFLGGSQTTLMNVLLRSNGERSAAFQAIWDLYLAGGMIAGSSAGAAIMSNPMIRDGTSTGALLNGVTTNTSGVRISTGAGFFEHGMTDQHFLARGRLGRLVVATAGAGFRYGFGVDEGCAFVVDNAAQTGTAIGYGSGTVVVDVGNMTAGPGNRRTGIVVHFIEDGDVWDFATGTILPAGNKTAITTPLYPAGPITSNDIWDGWEEWRLMTRLVDTAGASQALGLDPNFDVYFLRAPQTQAWRGAVHPVNSRRRYTIIHELMSIVPTGEDPLPVGLTMMGTI